jgi:hypothetical protein
MLILPLLLPRTLFNECRQRHQLGRLIGRDRRLAGLAGFVAQQARNARLGEALLPAPHGGPTEADALGNPLCRPPIGRGEHGARPLHVFLPLVAVGHGLPR